METSYIVYPESDPVRKTASGAMMIRQGCCVSVIIPAYNRFSLLREAIESVLAQTDNQYEIIVVDDGSTDKTHTIAETYKGKLRYLHQRNRGVSAARNRGIFEAKGDYICFLDSDDLWFPDKLAVQRAAMETDLSCQVSYTEEIWYRNGVRVNPMKKHAKHSGWIFEKSLRLCLISPSSVMIRRHLFDTIGTFSEDFPVCEDYDLWLRITKDYPVRLIEKPLITKRNGHPGQLSASGWGFDRYRVQSIVRLLSTGGLNREQTLAARLILKEKCRVLANGFYKRGNTDMGKYYETLVDHAVQAFNTTPPTSSV
jgi:GT2 family glycosyltransferase